MTHQVRAGLFCVLGGLCFTLFAQGTGHFGWWWIAGVLIATCMLPIAQHGPRRVWAQFGSMAAVLVIIGLFCTMSEGVLFFPETKKFLVPGLIGGTVIYVIIAALLAVLGRVLKVNAASDVELELRPAPAAVPMVLLSGLSYVLYYLVFGAIVFQFFTKKYYPHAVEQVMAMGSWFWAYQWGRGLMMTIAVLPVIYALRLPRWKTIIVAGMMVWIVGGGASLLVPSTYMVPAQRIAHIFEIMSQNVPLGMTAAWLLRPQAKRLAAPEKRVPAASMS
jgi:hypothetical protein